MQLELTTLVGFFVQKFNLIKHLLESSKNSHCFGTFRSKSPQGVSTPFSTISPVFTAGSSSFWTWYCIPHFSATYTLLVQEEIAFPIIAWGSS